MFQKYKYVLCVYEEQSFTGAARKLFISQPSLSVAIRNIEQKLGAPLFERIGSGAKPTEIGRAYIAAAEKMRHAEAAFRQQFEDLNELQTGTLVVGGSNYLSSDVIPQLVSRFRVRYPGIQITLVEANSMHLRQMLDREEVDLVIDNFEDFPEAYERFPLVEEHILLCVPEERAAHRSREKFQILPERIYSDPDCIKNMGSLEISAFREEPFVLLKSGNDMYDRAVQLFENGNMVPDVVFSVDQLNISYALAESGSGACFITDTFFKYRKHAGQVILYKLNDPTARRTLDIVYKKGRYCTKAMGQFIELTKEYVGEPRRRK